MKYKVFDIANWFLHQESMPQKKLQKLCYYAKAWSLVLLTNVDLDFSFQAWVHGPVNTELWNSFKGYGYIDIEQDALEKDAAEIDEKTEELLNLVWNTYGEFSGFQLEKLTHSEKPWIKAREGLAELTPSSRVIDEGEMKTFYYDMYGGEGIGE